MRILLSIAALGVVAELAAGTVLPEKYQEVVNRHPFGEPPQGFDPKKAFLDGASNAKEEKEIAAIQEQIVKNVSFSVINQETDGTVMVGFSDNTDPKQPQHYYIKVGEAKNGWFVKEADVAAKTMTLVKDEIEVELSLGDKSGSAKASQPQQKGGDAAESPRGRFMADGASPMSGFGRSRLARHRREMEDAKRKEEADKKAREEELRAREEEREERRRELEAIRQEIIRNREEQNAAAATAAAVSGDKQNEEN